MIIGMKYKTTIGAAGSGKGGRAPQFANLGTVFNTV